MRPRASRPPIDFGAAMQTIWLAGFGLALTACGGSHPAAYVPTSTTTEVENYTVGGTISGLTVGTVVLANGSTTVTIAAGASSWVFPGSFAPGSSYSVTIQTQPAGELCTIAGGGSGMNTGSVGNVAVVCGFGQWTWESGPNTLNATGVYGTLGTASVGSTPGARQAASSWTDASGNLWLFGGVGYDSTVNTGYLNDLWQYSPNTKLWTWISGGNIANASGVYGTLGTASVGSTPGARQAASSWTDASGNLWLFGGVGYSSTGSIGNLNDLWKYTPSTGLWTWVSGSVVANGSGIYGTQGAASATNVPGARYSASSWIDASGNLWLFGGLGYDAGGSVGNLSDLWQYSPSSGQWIWISGSTGVDASGVYGTQGTASATNVPGARFSANAWIDASGNVWLFGGYGYDSTGALGRLNDLWKYIPSSALWTWVGGEDAANAIGVYGALGTASVSNLPGARQDASSWIDASGNLWLFGGLGYDAGGSVGNLSDLWQYNLSTGVWTWISGTNRSNARGVYGTQGTTSVSNMPGGRNFSSSWIDASGALWLFGGLGDDSSGSQGYLNDLWQYNPSTGS